MNKIYAADLFCGAGGTSTGLLNACEESGYQLNLLAINHWDIAIATHSANHPYAKHICENLDNVDPRKAVPSGALDILIASPECTHHSNARGGKPCSDQSRASAWHVLRWAEALRIDNILIENVREFQFLGCWLILGAMTGAQAREHKPDSGVLLEIIQTSKKLKLPLFMKNNLKPYWPSELIQQWPERKNEKSL